MSDTAHVRMLASAVSGICDELDATKKALGESEKTVAALLEEIKRLKVELRETEG